MTVTQKGLPPAPWATRMIFSFFVLSLGRTGGGQHDTCDDEQAGENGN